MSRDLNSASDGNDSACRVEPEQLNKATEMKRYMDANPEIVQSMFKVYANLFDEPKQLKVTEA